MLLQELLVESLPQTQIRSLSNRTTIIHDGQIFGIGRETVPQGDFAKLFGRYYAIIPGERLDVLESVYEEDGAARIVAWEQAFISRLLTKIPSDRPVAPDPPEVQADPVLKYLVKELIPYLINEKDESVKSAKDRVFDILRIKREDNADKNVNMPAEEKVLSAGERITYLQNNINEQFSALSGFMDTEKSAFYSALRNDKLLLTQGLVYTLDSKAPAPWQNHIRIAGHDYVLCLSSVLAEDLEGRVQLALKAKHAAKTIASDKELNARIQKINKYEENIYQKVFRNPIEEADGKTYLIPETKYGIHVREKNIVGDAKYYIFISTPRCAVPATASTKEGFMTIQGVFYEMKPMHPAIPLAYENGRIVLKPLCVINRLSNHQAFDETSKSYGTFYDRLCVLEFRHYQLAGKGYNSEADALNDFVKPNLEKGIRDILVRKLYSVVVYSRGTGHALSRDKFAGQEITEEEARANGLIL